jgi:hypothetical protein
VFTAKDPYLQSDELRSSVKTIIELFTMLEEALSRLIFRKTELSFCNKESNNSIQPHQVTEVQNKNNQEVFDLFEMFNMGNLIPLSCGHNGIMDHEELSLYQEHLEKAKMIRDK